MAVLKFLSGGNSPKTVYIRMVHTIQLLTPLKKQNGTSELTKLQIRSAVSRSHPQRKFSWTGVAEVP